jgi:hypothetical protein
VSAFASVADVINKQKSTLAHQKPGENSLIQYEDLFADKPEVRSYAIGIFERPFKNGDRVSIKIPEAGVGMTQRWRIEYCEETSFGSN